MRPGTEGVEIHQDRRSARGRDRHLEGVPEQLPRHSAGGKAQGSRGRRDGRLAGDDEHVRRCDRTWRSTWGSRRPSPTMPVRRATSSSTGWSCPPPRCTRLPRRARRRLRHRRLHRRDRRLSPGAGGPCRGCRVRAHGFGRRGDCHSPGDGAHLARLESDDSAPMMSEARSHEAAEAKEAEWLRTMIRIRLFEESLADLHTRGLLVGVVHLSVGQEATAVGICSALREGDQITSDPPRTPSHARPGARAESHVRRDPRSGRRLLRRQGRVHARELLQGRRGGRKRDRGRGDPTRSGSRSPRSGSGGNRSPSRSSGTARQIRASSSNR